MESIRIKMDGLITEKKSLIKQAEVLEENRKNYENRIIEGEKQVIFDEKLINKMEEEWDRARTSFEETSEKLEQVHKTTNDAELEISAQDRKIRLIEEETARVIEKYTTTIKTLSEVESRLDETERRRKIVEAHSCQLDDKLEFAIQAYEQASLYAEEADRKYEESQRKLMMLQEELERIEIKYAGNEKENEVLADDILLQTESLKALEDAMLKNCEKEDWFDNQISELNDKLKHAETDAEFGERTVDKLEGNIDHLQDMLFGAKCAFREISDQLDQTLRDMMVLAEC